MTPAVILPTLTARPARASFVGLGLKSGLSLGLTIGLTLGLTLGLGLPAKAAGQVPGQAWVDVRPHEPVVSMAIQFPVGADQDAEGKEGTAYLLGRVIEAEANRRLEGSGGRAEVRVERGRILALVQLPPALWERGWVELATLLSAASFSEPEWTRERDSHRNRLLFQSGAPSRTFDALWHAFRLQGVEGIRFRVGDPVEGSLASLASLESVDLLRFRGEHLRWTDSRASVVGPLDPDDVARVLRTSVQVIGHTGAEGLGAANTGANMAANLAADLAADTLSEIRTAIGSDTLGVTLEDELPFGSGPKRVNPPTPRFTISLEGAPQERLWSLGAREIRDEDLTSTWIGIAWALPATTPLILMDFMAHLVGEALNTTPPEPGLFRADVRIEMEGRYPLLVVLATVDPQATRRWEDRILSAVEAMAQIPPEGAFFELARRRYRSARLMAQETPAYRAGWITAQGARLGRIPSVASDVWGLSRDGLSALASARGEPRILLYGPRSMIGTGLVP